MIDVDKCYECIVECIVNGDDCCVDCIVNGDYYYLDGNNEWVKACDDCQFNDLIDWEEKD